MIKLVNKYKPQFIVLICFMFHFLSSYPGGMGPDSIAQFEESLSGNYSSHHPPLMAMLWSILNIIYTGPQSMLIMHISALWGSILLLYLADESNEYRKWYFILPFYPMILSQSTMIWKDVGFAYSTLLIIACYFYYSSRQSYISNVQALALLLVAFYAVGIKFQAKFILIFLTYLISKIYIKKSATHRLVFTILLSALIIAANSFIIKHYTKDTNSQQIRQFYDIAGIAVKVDDPSLFPEHVSRHQEFDFEGVKNNYTPKWVDTLYYHNKYFSISYEPNEIELMEQAFWEAIKKHPFEYLQHRLANFAYSMRPETSYFYAYIGDDTVQTYNLHNFKFNILKKLVIKYLKLVPSLITGNYINLLILLAYAFYLIKDNDKTSSSYNVIKYISLITFAYYISLFITTQASDYRYHFIIRLILILSLPIYFHNISKMQLVRIKNHTC